MIVVLGAINIDMHMRLQRFPVAGERMITPAYEWLPGGKGMNQAVAAARYGVKVAMVGCVGDDGFGTRALNTLRREGILSSGVIQSDDLPTGCASIFVEDSGESAVVLAQGANTQVNPAQVPDDILGPSNMLLMQMELPEEVNWDVLDRANAHGATTILNLAPANALPKEALPYLDYLVLNHIEAEQIARSLGLKIETDALKLAYAISQNAHLTCVITLSGRGSVAVENGVGWRVPAVLVDVEDIVDTTGAGDAYCGVMAACLHQKMPLPEAMRRASVAGSLCVRAKGSQGGLPYVDDIAALMEDMPEAERVDF